MIKKKNWNNLEAHDYWMGVAFLLAAKSKFGNASIIIDNSGKLLCYGLQSNPPFCDSPQHVIPSEIMAIVNYDKTNHNVTMYSTCPPCHESSLAILACAGIKSIIYFPKGEADVDVLEAIRSSYCDIEAYDCNLNWIRDYFATIEHK